MNIVKLQNDLKNVPDQALIGYVQNPTGQVPSYLALSELQRRKEMRAKYQQAQPEKTTVAEDLEKQVQPSGLAMLAQNPAQGSPTMSSAPQEAGVAGLPTGDMYDEKNFASGGIVAFADGGMPEATSRFGSWFGGLRAANLAQQDINKQLNALLSEKARLQHDYFTPLTDEQKAAQQSTVAQIDSMIANLQAQKASPNAPTATTGGPRDVAPAQLPQSITGVTAPSQFGVSPNAISQMGPQAAPAAPGAKPSAFDYGGLYQPLTDYSKEYAALQQNPANMAETEMARYKQLVGEDKFRPQLEEKLKKMEERSAKSEEQAPWMALARAGLGMAAGKSPYALQNIAEGATMGLDDYNKAKDKLESAREKQFDLQARIAQAQRAEDIAAATHGIQSEQHIKAQNHATKLAELGYKANREATNQKNKIDAYEAVNKGKLYGAQADYYGQKGPSGDVTEKDLWKGYVSSGGELINGPWEAYKQKYLPKAIPTDVNNLVSKYLK